MRHNIVEALHFFIVGQLPLQKRLIEQEERRLDLTVDGDEEDVDDDCYADDQNDRQVEQRTRQQHGQSFVDHEALHVVGDDHVYEVQQQGEHDDGEPREDVERFGVHQDLDVDNLVS